MAIAHISTVASRNSATTSHVVSLPTVSSGDVIVVAIAWNGSAGTVTWPAGWTIMPGTTEGFGTNANPKMSVRYRVCDGTEGASITVTTTSSIASGHSAGAYSGVDNTTPIDVNATINNGTTGTTATATNITTVTNNTWPIGGAAANSSTQSFTTGWTTPTGVERSDVQAGQASGTGKAETVSDSNGAFATGTTASITWTISSSLAWTAWLTALRPAAGGTNFSQTLSATATGTASVARGTGKALAASATGTSTMARQSSKTLAATATGTASQSSTRNVLQTLAATAVGTATIQSARAFFQTLSATATGTATIPREVGKILSAGASGLASMIENATIITPPDLQAGGGGGGLVTSRRTRMRIGEPDQAVPRSGTSPDTEEAVLLAIAAWYGMWW